MALTRFKSQRPCRRDATRRSRATAPGFPGNSSVTHHQQRQGKQGKQSRPRLDLRDPRLGKAQLPFGIAKPFLTAKPPGILRGRRLSPAQAIGNQVPGVPLPVAVARAAQSQPQVGAVSDRTASTRPQTRLYPARTENHSPVWSPLAYFFRG